MPGHRAPGTPSAATAEQLAGTWRDDAGNTLALRNDGGYTASAMLDVYDNDARPSTGQWRVAAPRHDPNGPATTVVLGVATVLRIYATPDGLVLAMISSDPAVHPQQVYRPVAHSG